MKDEDGNDDCRYAIYNVCSASYVLLFFWCPESSKTETKQLYSSSVDSLKKVIGVPKNKNVNSIEKIEKIEGIVADIKELWEMTLADAAAEIAQANARGKSSPISVSYTHLTLPTIYSV